MEARQHPPLPDSSLPLLNDLHDQSRRYRPVPEQQAPYAPQQGPATYEAAPAGFSQIFVETVARHGSRGLSSPTNDLALYDLWLAAPVSGGLTKAGTRLGPDILRVIQANALLGCGVPGIAAPGY
jgi:hypothetical protein